MGTKKESTKGTKADTIIFLLIFAALFFIPLVYFKGTNELFEFPKMHLAYLLISSAGLVFTLKKLFAESQDYASDVSEQTKKPIALKTITKLTQAIINRDLRALVLLFLVANAISTLISILPYTSVFGYYTRFNGGFASSLLWTSLFFILVYTTDYVSQKRLPFVICASSILVSIYAVLQRMGLEKGYWVEDSQVRVFSSLGQPNWLAAFLVLTTPIMFERMLSSENKKFKLLFCLTSLFNLSALWFTYSFSGFLGLFFTLALFFSVKDKQVLKKNAGYLGVTFVAFLAVMVLNPGVFTPKLKDSINDIKSILGSIDNTVYAQDQSQQNTPAQNEVPKRPAFGDTTGIRLNVWQGTLNLIFSSPRNMLIGTGPETFPYAFLAFRPESMNLTTEWDFVFNKPHNYYLELAANLGLFGLGAYLMMISRVFKTITNQKTIAYKAGLLGLFVTDFFGWHTVVASMLMYTFMALIYKAESHEQTA